MRKIDGLIFKVLKVPEGEKAAILDAVGPETQMPAVSKMSVVAWSLLCVYDESPLFVMVGALCAFFVMPFFVLLKYIGG